ncbi:uncharacterized protein isoform X2 [Musca autumnalis]|uniref:uncharacterized protein isoform X2 n=1 Tax=Musca autumnalis TaxID=221902 RepID=UPI003CE8D70C
METQPPGHPKVDGSQVEEEWERNQTRSMKEYRSCKTQWPLETDEHTDNNDDGATSTSFSLEECMNEFRARRVRRTSTHSRQEGEKRCNNDKDVNSSDRDLINQNLSNKQQERKCKPCKDGFCYCFTSDSGDGGAGVSETVNRKEFRGHKSSEYDKGFDNKHTKTNKMHVKTPSDVPHKQKNGDRVSQVGHISAISRLETTGKDAPLIHIIQELRDNCVISEVRVNKNKLNYRCSKDKSNSDRAKNKVSEKTYKDLHKKQSTNRHSMPMEPHTPSAPPLDNISEECPSMTEKTQTVRRHKAGGRLLQKRLSISNAKYKQRESNDPPPKPPRSSLSVGENSSKSSSSTSSSVREAERILDEFLANRGYKNKRTADASKNLPHYSRISRPQNKQENRIRQENEKRKSYPLGPEEKIAKQVLATYPSLSDLEGTVQSKKCIHYDKNIRSINDNNVKIHRIGWNDPKIHDMLNYESNKNEKLFRSTSTQAGPQQTTQNIGWDVPPKLNIDTVDGIGRHNMASNFEIKNTPTKGNVVHPKHAKQTCHKQKRIWPQHIRNFSPWGKKTEISKEIHKNAIGSSSKKFLKSSKRKILRLVSPKKENKERQNIEIRKTPYRNVAVQTLNEDFHRQSPPGSYHSPLQSQSLSCSASQNITTNENDSENPNFDFSRQVNSPPKKPTRSSQRKLFFPLDCSPACIAKNVTTQNDKKTYKSFNEELDQDVSLSKMSYILSNIRAKLEASDDHAIRTFQSFWIPGPDPAFDSMPDVTSKNQISKTKIRYDFELTGPMDIFIRPWRKNKRMVFPLDTFAHDWEPPYFIYFSYGINGDPLKFWLEIEESHRGQHEDGMLSQTHYPNCVDCHNEPIYSEIEDDSIHISESPNLETRTGIQHFNVQNNPNVLYALVDKSNKNIRPCSTQQRNPTSLGTILHDSLKSKRNTQKISSLSPLPEPPEGEVSSLSSPSSFEGQLIQYQSLNNVRVMEHNSPPKRLRNLSKSDLSLHRSEIFLENLCRSEVVLENLQDSVNGHNLQKVENKSSEQSNLDPRKSSTEATAMGSTDYTMEDDAVSYELPVNEQFDVNDSVYDNLASKNQSTPKKPSFTTKDKYCHMVDGMKHQEMEYDEHISSSCPSTPNKLLQNTTNTNTRAYSLNVISDIQSSPKNQTSSKLLPNLRSALNKSFRRSKDFVKRETKKIPNSLNFKKSKSDDLRVNVCKNVFNCQDSTVGSDIDLDSLLSISQSASISEQLVHVVNICRNFPESEISSEMVEAERLLLFSALRRESQGKSPAHQSERTLKQTTKSYIFIDDMFLPIREDPTRDIFFNYFYIVTFECGGIIRSTQSAECQKGLAIFRDCGMEFMLHSDQIGNNENEGVHCNIFMLRLRKVSCVTTESNKMKLKEMKGTTSNTSSSSSIDLVSRFRLQASFTLTSKDFIPFEMVLHESIKSHRTCLRSSRTCNIVLTSSSTSSNLSGEIQVKGRAELRIPKIIHAGYLNVEDPNTQHNWNRRWCVLDGINLQIWRDENTLNQSPLLVVYIQATMNTIRPAPRDLCARPRSFCLTCTIPKLDDQVAVSSIFFAADTQEDLNEWLDKLNRTLSLINCWLS